MSTHLWCVSLGFCAVWDPVGSVWFTGTLYSYFRTGPLLDREDLLVREPTTRRLPPAGEASPTGLQPGGRPRPDSLKISSLRGQPGVERLRMRDSGLWSQPGAEQAACGAGVRRYAASWARASPASDLRPPGVLRGRWFCGGWRWRAEWFLRTVVEELRRCRAGGSELC